MRARLCITLWLSTALTVGCDDDGAESTQTNDDLGVVADTGGGDLEPDTGAEEPDMGAEESDSGVEDPDTGAEPDPDMGMVDDTAPAIQGLTVVENPNNPLSALVEFTTDEVANIEVSIEGAERSWTVPRPDEAGMAHRAVVIGMRFESTYAITIRAWDEAGNETVEDQMFETVLPPDDLPQITAEGATEGYTLFDVGRWNPGFDREFGMLLIVDAEGHVVWMHRDERIEDTRRLDDGRLLYISGDHSFVFANMWGEITAEVDVEEVLGVDTVHHEIYPLPNGNLVFLSTALHVGVEGYTDENDEPVAYDVVSDVVVEVDLANNAVVAAHDLFDILDPINDTTPLFNNPFWDVRYANESEGTKDWTHGNAVIDDPSDDSFILSLRHVNKVVKIDRATGDYVWALGERGDFILAGEDADWQYAQHAPELIEPNRILLFDNGNGRPNAEVPYSRAVEYVLDTEAMTATQVWEFAPAGVYAPYVSEADLLPNGNVLVNAGGQIADPTGGIFDPANLKFAQIFEVTHTPDPEVLWTLSVRDDAEENPNGYFVYRAERLETLYP